MSQRIHLLLLLASVALLGSASCNATASREKGSSQPAAAPPAPAVAVIAPQTVLSAQNEEVTGTLKPAKGLALGFEVGGRLSRIRVQKGAQVKAGQVLAELDAEIADAQVAQAEAAMAAAEAGFGLASDVAERNERLQAQGSVSDVQSRSAVTNSKQSRAQLLAAKAALAQARAARKKHELRAPFAGTVVSAPEQPGATVGPGAPLFVLEQVDSLLLQTTIAESTRAHVRPGQPVKVSSVAANATSDEATIRTIVPSADPATRRIPVDIVVPNADGRFIAHTLARAVFTLGEPAPAQALPSTALSSSGGDHVYVVADGVARRVPVRVLDRGATEVVVRADQPLAQVINHPGSAVADGVPVTVQ